MQPEKKMVKDWSVSTQKMKKMCIRDSVETLQGFTLNTHSGTGIQYLVKDGEEGRDEMCIRDRMGSFHIFFRVDCD